VVTPTYTNWYRNDKAENNINDKRYGKKQEETSGVVGPWQRGAIVSRLDNFFLFGKHFSQRNEIYGCKSTILRNSGGKLKF